MIYSSLVMKRLIIFMILSIMLATEAFSEDTPTRLRLGRVAYTDPETILVSHWPLQEFLTAHVGIKVEIMLFLSYEEIAHRLRKGKLEMGWLGTSFYAGLDERNFYPLVRPIWRGRYFYQGQILTREDSPLKQLSDLKGKRLALVSPSSSSGYTFPVLMMAKAGVRLEDLEEYSFLDKHDAVVYAVLTRQFDAGATYSGILEQDHLKENAPQFRILAKTAPISNEPIVIRDDLPERVIQLLQRGFLESGARNVLDRVKNLDGFVEANDSDFDSVRHLTVNNE